MKLDKAETITPTEYSKYSFINDMVYRIKGPVKTACDIGCGVGNLLFCLENYDIQFTGIDSSPESLAIAREKSKSSNVTFLQEDVFGINKQYDLILLTDVLEHINDDTFF